MNYKTIILAIIVLVSLSCNRNNEDSFAYGNFEAEEIIVSAKVSGDLLLFNANEGDLISKNMLLGVIDSTQLHLKKLQLIASSNAIRTGIAEIDAQIKVNDINLKNLKREQERFKNLYNENAATGKQLDDINGQMELVDAQNSALDTKKKGIIAQLESNNMQLKQAEDQIEKCILRAPSDGTLLEIFIREGELARPGKSLYKMANLDELILRVFISGNQLSSVQTRDTVRVIFDGPSDNLSETNGVISWISSEAEFTPKIIQTREERVNLVYAAKINVKNDGSLKIGMPGEIVLISK
jgi:HlyD family secretion protein